MLTESSNKTLERDVAGEGLQFESGDFMEFLSFRPRGVVDRHAAQFFRWATTPHHYDTRPVLEHH